MSKSRNLVDTRRANRRAVRRSLNRLETRGTAPRKQYDREREEAALAKYAAEGKVKRLPPKEHTETPHVVESVVDNLAGMNLLGRKGRKG